MSSNLQKKVAVDNVILVIGHQAEKVRKIVSESCEVVFAIQEKQLGTGHAILCVLPYLLEYTEEVVL